MPLRSLRELLSWSNSARTVRGAHANDELDRNSDTRVRSGRGFLQMIPMRRDIETEYGVWVRMFGREEADRLREQVERDGASSGRHRGSAACWREREGRG